MWKLFLTVSLLSAGPLFADRDVQVFDDWQFIYDDRAFMPCIIQSIAVDTAGAEISAPPEIELMMTDRGHVGPLMINGLEHQSRGVTAWLGAGDVVIRLQGQNGSAFVMHVVPELVEALSRGDKLYLGYGRPANTDHTWPGGAMDLRSASRSAQFSILGFAEANSVLLDRCAGTEEWSGPPFQG